MKKIILTLLAFSVWSLSAVAEDGFYGGVKYSKLKVDYSTIDGLDLNDVYEQDFNSLDYHVGYNMGNWFFEGAYVDAGDESKNLASVTSGIYTLTIDSKVEIDGFRFGTGYNHQINDNFSIRPFVNMYELDTTATISGTITNGTDALTASAQQSGSDTMIDGGVGLQYSVNEKFNIGASYSTTIDEIEDTDKVETTSITASYKF